MAIDEREFPGADMEGYVREAMTFVGVDEADLERVRRTAPLVLKHETELTSALYEHFLKFPHSAKFFLAPDGTPDAARIERRKHSLGRWLRETAQAAVSHDFSYYLLAIALSHSHRAHGPGGRVPARLMVGAMSLTQTALARVLEAELGDPREAFEASLSWNKVLLVHLSVLLIGYLLPPPPARG
jgi:hypothetical protein